MAPLPVDNWSSATAGGALFYTYIWRDVNGTPFYVGKGKGRRAWDTIRRSRPFLAEFKKGGCTVHIADFFINESQAHSHEVELIERYGRRDLSTGNLVNLTDGGEGAVGLCEEAKKKISDANKGNKYAVGAIRSQETRARISASKNGQRSRLGAVLSKESRERISASLKGRKLSAEHKLRLSIVSRGIQKPREHVSNVMTALHLVKPRPDSGSGFKGVSRNRGRWVARITTNGVRRNIGFYETPEAAARAYDAAAVEAWGIGNCYLNFEYCVK